MCVLGKLGLGLIVCICFVPKLGLIIVNFSLDSFNDSGERISSWILGIIPFKIIEVLKDRNFFVLEFYEPFILSLFL